MTDKTSNVPTGAPDPPPPADTDGSRVDEHTAGSVPAPPPNVQALNSNAFDSLVNYVQEDLVAVAEDYKLLEKMNKVAVQKYAEMKEISTNVHIEMTEINEKYRNLAPYLEQIDQIEDQVAALEEVAYRLDAYSKRLETKFKQLEKRS